MTMENSSSSENDPLILSHFQLKTLKQALRRDERQVQVSLNLNLTQSPVELDATAIYFADGTQLTWDDAQDILDDENGCFVLEADGLRKIQSFSSTTRRHCTLYPTTGAPTLLIAGFPMHRIKNTDPYKDTLSKIRAASPQGMVLDTSMGLGYTAIQAAKTSQHVITLEIDPSVVEIARQNPWSRELFTNTRIERRLAHSAEEIETFDDGEFTRIIHDPPVFSLAGELYSGVYYQELFRILRRGGRLFHYIGDLKSPSGARVVRGVIERLGKAGFVRIDKRFEAFGVVAFKP